MKITMDPVANASYIELRKGVVARTVQLSETVLIDFSKSGEVLGIEILSDDQPAPRRKSSAARKLKLASGNKIRSGS